MKIRTLATGALAASLVVTSTFAQELEPWGHAEGWDIMIDSSLGDGCLIQAEYQDGSVIRMGFDRNQGTAYVTAFNENWGRWVKTLDHCRQSRCHSGWVN